MFQTLEKSTPLPTVISWIPEAVAGLRVTARIQAQAASAMMTLNLKELRSNMKDIVKFWSR